MPLLNYTTDVNVDKTVGQVQSILRTHGVKSIQIDYDTQNNPVAVAFSIETNYGLRSFRLPANIEAVHKVLIRQWQNGQIDRRYSSFQQAQRTGWRIVKDWLEAQMSILEAEMVSLDQVMFPYMLDSNQKPLYEAYKEHQLALPSPNK